MNSTATAKISRGMLHALILLQFNKDFKLDNFCAEGAKLRFIIVSTNFNFLI